MKITRIQQCFVAVTLVIGATVSTAQAQTARFDQLANAPFEENRPTKETTQMLRDGPSEQNAEAGLGLVLSPLVNMRALQLC